MRLNEVVANGSKADICICMCTTSNSFPNVTVTPLPSWEKVASPAVFARLVGGGEEGDPGLDIFLPVLHFSSAFPHFAPTKDGKKRNVLPIYSVSVLIT